MSIVAYTKDKLDSLFGGKADLTGGTVPDTQLPARLSDVELRAASDAAAVDRLGAFSVKHISYGAKCDTRGVQRGAIASGSAVLTSASAVFTSADVGKAIFVGGAGTSGAPLLTTIASVQSATQATLSATAGTAVVDSRTVTDGNTTYGSRTVTSATAAFTASDLNKTINVTSGGNVLTAIITAVNSATSVNLSMFPQFTTTTASVAVSGPDVVIGTDDTAAVQAAINAAQTTGEGVITLPGVAFITSTLTVTGGARGPRDNFQPSGMTFRGVGQKSSGLFAGHAGDLIHYSGYREMAHLENLRLIGPGRTVAGSRGLWFDGASGAYNLTNVLVDNFEVGTEWYDNTNGTNINVIWRNNKTGIRTDFNHDAHVYLSCQFVRNDTHAVIGYATGAKSGTTAQENSGIVFQRCLFNHSLLAVQLLDVAASGIDFPGCYFEGNVKEMEIGSAGASNIMDGIDISGAYFNPYTNAGAVPTAVGIELLQRANVTIRNCKINGATSYTVFCKADISDGTIIAWEMNDAAAVTAQVQYAGRNYNPGRTTMVIGSQMQYVAQGDVAPFTTGPFFSKEMSGSTGRTLESWTKRNGSTNAVAGEVTVRDVGGVLRIDGGSSSTPGFLGATSISALPTAGVNYRGCWAYVPGNGTTTADQLYVCLLSAAGTYSWKPIVSG